jgi:hypothetical protein
MKSANDLVIHESDARPIKSCCWKEEDYTDMIDVEEVDDGTHFLVTLKYM